MVKNKQDNKSQAMICKNSFGFQVRFNKQNFHLKLLKRLEKFPVFTGESDNMQGA